MLKLKDNILNFLITPKGKIIARFITFLVAVFSFWSTISFFNTFKPYLYKNMKNSNLEILIEAIQSHWKIGFGTSITVAFFIISTITLIASFTNICKIDFSLLFGDNTYYFHFFVSFSRNRTF